MTIVNFDNFVNGQKCLRQMSPWTTISWTIIATMGDGGGSDVGDGGGIDGGGVEGDGVEKMKAITWYLWYWFWPRQGCMAP